MAPLIECYTEILICIARLALLAVEKTWGHPKKSTKQLIGACVAGAGYRYINSVACCDFCGKGKGTMFTSGLPHFAKGTVIKGFGRGSKDLGIPTANFGSEVVDFLPKELKTGVYFGFANIDDGPVYKMVMSIGWNPYYKNEKKSVETHVIHDFGCDFYGKVLKVCMLGYLRPETSFNSLDDLIKAIQKDISDADQYLEDPKFKKYENDQYFTID